MPIAAASRLRWNGDEVGCVDPHAARHRLILSTGYSPVLTRLLWRALRRFPLAGMTGNHFVFPLRQLPVLPIRPPWVSIVRTADDGFWTHVGGVGRLRHGM